MFSVRQKRDIADKIQSILRETKHPELPPEDTEISFRLEVIGSSPMSWAVILNNGSVPIPHVNPHNERQDPEAGHGNT